ncbi:MAG: polysaccharide deacetylase family protein, partial [Chitinophagaceae bacterium]|nr:polysaccharide deacetylase family protein [Chitinophagaceae bacterium]
MINFRNTNIFFATLLIILAGLFLSWGISLSILIVVPVIYSVVLFWGCYNVRSNFFIPIICAADTSKMQIAISFDDGPEPTLTPAILRVLKDNNVEAAFFCIGNRIEGNEELLVQIHKEHHIIGNHSYTHHFWFDLYSVSKMHADLRLMDEQVKKV